MAVAARFALAAWRLAAMPLAAGVQQGPAILSESLAGPDSFSRTVHLLLDVEETDWTIRFRDACHKSFEVYDGSGTITPQEAGTELTYELTAKPAFSVPGAVLKRLLERDFRETIEGLRADITTRASMP